MAVTATSVANYGSGSATKAAAVSSGRHLLSRARQQFLITGKPFSPLFSDFRFAFVEIMMLKCGLNAEIRV
ncbi:hypothetical protein L2E82_22000 [Cichorium intybus]|uniref:Uncharacterized protein n=1 Tax=Cichorium intybus TaxID=13427 RepID=A0ACB9DX38_CICIN|nr:hypothetical protein L2E82_22000 [Cichorium intybus]